jgi:hypothetical protein
VTGIEVDCGSDGEAWRCSVRLTDDSGTGEHFVRVAQADLERLAPGSSDPTDLVRRSFAFLLERERRTSILEEFDLPVIGRYFPEYEGEMSQAGGSPQANNSPR